MGASDPHWAYEDHKDVNLVHESCIRLIAELSLDKSELNSVLNETRPVHKTLFADVTPVGFSHLAGNYRGANLPYLHDHNVVLQTSTGVVVHEGTRCDLVAAEMANFHSELVKQFQKFKIVAIQLAWSAKQKLIAFSKLVGVFFAAFVSIHPYANGNGHVSRILVWCIFNKHSVSCAFWDVSKRNAKPADYLIAKYQRNDVNPLLECFLELIESENADVAVV